MDKILNSKAPGSHNATGGSFFTRRTAFLVACSFPYLDTTPLVEVVCYGELADEKSVLWTFMRFASRCASLAGFPKRINLTGTA